MAPEGRSPRLLPAGRPVAPGSRPRSAGSRGYMCQTDMPRLSRHALDLRYKTRIQWLTAGGLTPETFAKAIQTLVEGCEAVKSDGRDKGRSVVPDYRTRVMAATALADLIRHTVGLTANVDNLDQKRGNSQVAVIVNLPAWIRGDTPQDKGELIEGKVTPLPPQNQGSSSGVPIDSAAGEISALPPGTVKLYTGEVRKERYGQPGSMKALRPITWGKKKVAPDATSATREVAEPQLPQLVADVAVSSSYSDKQLAGKEIVS